MVATEIILKTEYTDDDHLEIDEVKQQIVCNTYEHKQLYFRFKIFFSSPLIIDYILKTRMTTSINSEAGRNQTSILIRGRENQVFSIT